MRIPSDENKLPQVSKTSPKTHLLVALLLGVLVAVGYVAVITTPFFLGDDFPIIDKIASPQDVRSWGGVASDFQGPVLGRHAMYRPLYTLSFAIDYSLFGMVATGYHLTNLFLHLISSFFVYLVTLELVRGERSRGAAILAGAIFAVHPIHPEAVAWISGRVDLICAAFYLPALFFFLRWLRAGTRLYLALSLAAFVLSLMSKEMAVTLPGLLFLCVVFEKKSVRDAVVKVLPFAVILGIYLLLRGYFLSGVEASRFLVVDAETLAQSMRGFIYRTLHLFVPVNLSLLPRLPRVLLHEGFLLYLWPVLPVVAYFLFRAKDKLPLLLSALYILSVVPVFSALGQDPLLTTSRWFYIPSIFASMLIAYLLWSLIGRVRWRVVASVAVCAVFLAVLVANNGTWVRSGEISDRLLDLGAEPTNYPLKYQGAYMFASDGYWQIANSPPFDGLRGPSEPGTARVIVRKVEPEDSRLVLQPKLGRPVAFDFDPKDSRVWLDGERASLEDVEPGQRGTVSYLAKRTTNTARQLVLKR